MVGNHCFISLILYCLQVQCLKTHLQDLKHTIQVNIQYSWAHFFSTGGMSANPPASEEGVQVPRKIPRRHSHMAEDKIHAHTHRTRIPRTTDTGQTSCCEHVAETVTDSGREGKPIQEGVGGRHRECDFGFLCWGACWCQKWTRMQWRKKKDRMLH